MVSYLTTPFHLHHARILSIFFLLVIGCAASRSQIPSKEISAESKTEPVNVTFWEMQNTRVDQLIRRTFLDGQAGKFDLALTSLDSASTILGLLFIKKTTILTQERLCELLKITLELYRNLIPKTIPIRPKCPLAFLLDSLPHHLVPNFKTHPNYQEFWIRKLAGLSDVPIDFTPQVAESIHFFQNKGRKTFEKWLSRSGTYLPMIREIFREANLPQDLAFKAMIESGFNPRAYSRAHASGMWQFLQHTATLYGLRRNFYLDERRDPEKSTVAAAHHLKYLHALFDDWRLAIAAYNCGQGRLNRAIRKSKTRNFWKIDTLPRETRKHLPRFMAVVLISKDPEWFGFSNVLYQRPIVFDQVLISQPIDLHVAAQCADTTYNSIKQLNPELRRSYTPVSLKNKKYNLRIPLGTLAKFKKNYVRFPPRKNVQIIDYKVQNGDTISEIAWKLGVQTKPILDANGINNPRRVHSGRIIKIPIHQKSGTNFLAKKNKLNGNLPLKEALNAWSLYTVKQGDTLWDIAHQEGVIPSQLQTWNNISSADLIFPGNRLIVWKPKNSAADLNKKQSTEKINEIFYTVKRGDTLWELAQTFRTSIEALKILNNLGHSSRIRTGTLLLVRPEKKIGKD